MSPPARAHLISLSLVLGLTVSLDLVWGQGPAPVYLSLGGTNITTNNTELIITDIGQDDTTSLTCHTELFTCCRGSDGVKGGEWYYPNGTKVPNNAGTDDFARVKTARSLTRLYRRIPPAALSPTGLYCCVIPITVVETQTFCVDLVLFSITTQPTKQADIILGQDVSFSVTVGGEDSVTYQWQKDGVNITDTADTYSGTTSPTLTVLSVGEGDAGSYTCVVTGSMRTVSSNPAQLALTVDCGAPPSISNGSSVTPTSTRVGGTVTYTCNNGYRISPGVTMATVYCMASRSWETVPNCSVVDCGTPPSISNGSPGTPTKTTFEGTVTYACNNGYQKSTMATVSCMATGNWETVPTCSAVDCGTPPSISNGSPGTPTNTTFEGTVTYTCNNGYQISTGVTMTTVSCMATGNWETVTCSVVDCGTPPSITNGSPGIPTKTTFGETVTYTCNNGYQISTMVTVSCLATGNWETVPTCSVVDCGTLPPVSNGSPGTLTKTTLGGTVTYTCNNGYKISPGVTMAIVSCMATGNWETVPTCSVVDCGTPPSISNGSPGTLTKTTFGGTVTYTCINGYQKSPGVTMATVSCLTTGNWETVPTCSEIRINFTLAGKTYLNNSVVAINDIGVEDNAYALLCVTDNTDCCKPPDGNTGQGEFYYPNQTLVRVYNTGDSMYRNRGPQVVRLHRRNNALSPTGVYRCEIPDFSGMNQSIYINITAVDCGLPPSISNGSPGTPTKTSFGGTVTYTCNNGYQISTMATVSCLATGNWETGPTCSAICADLRPLMNGAITYQPAGTFQLEGTTATHSCTSGYRLSGGPVRVCQSDRIWSGDTITCLGIRILPSAGDPPTLGQNYSLTCTVTGADTLNPTISYQWTRGSTTVGTNSAFLTFDYLVLSDTGYYRCEVTISSNLLSVNIRAVSDMFDLEIPITDLLPVAVFIQLLFRGIYNCPEYRQANAKEILQEVTNGFVEAIQGLCGCGLTAEHVSKSFVQCFSDQIAFRAQLNQTSQATTKELVSYIDQWVRSPGHLIVQGSLLQLNTSCSLVITDQFVSSECPSPLPGDHATTETLPSSGSPSSQPDNTGTIVGGVVVILGLGLILAVTAVIITYLVLKQRRMGGMDLKRDTPDVPLSVIGQSPPSQPYETVDVTYEEIDKPRPLKGMFELSQCEAYVTTTPSSRRESVVNIERSGITTEETSARGTTYEPINL